MTSYEEQLISRWQIDAKRMKWLSRVVSWWAECLLPHDQGSVSAFQTIERINHRLYTGASIESSSWTWNMITMLACISPPVLSHFSQITLDSNYDFDSHFFLIKSKKQRAFNRFPLNNTLADNVKRLYQSNLGSKIN